MQITTISLAALSLLLPATGLATEKETNSRLSKDELDKLGVASEIMNTEVENCYTCSANSQSNLFFIAPVPQLENDPQNPTSVLSNDNILE